METGLFLGLAIFVLGGIVGGGFAFPQKFVKTFAWENTWGTFWLFTMVVIPAFLTPLCVRDISAIWREAGFHTVIIPIVFGLLWGVGALTFGGTIHMLGLSLGNTLIMGTVVALGSLLPLAVLHREKIPTLGGFVVLLGIAISLVGVVLIGYAGLLKERALRENERSEQKGVREKPRIGLGLVIGLVSGITSSCLNLGFAFSAKIPKLAMEQFGTPAWAAGLASWQLVFWGGFVTCGTFAASLMIRNGTWRKYGASGAVRDSGLALCMAILHMASVLLYGIGAYYIGTLGTSLGFAAFLSIVIIVGNILGFVTREWQGVGAKPVRWIIGGTVVLVVSICVLGLGNALSE